MGSPRILPGAPGVALIGGGFIGPVHAEALRRIGVPVVGLLGSSEARARSTARLLGIPRVYADLDALLADPEVDAVHVASPNAAHFEQARAALTAGKHVICEKPLAVTSAQTGELARLAAERPRQATAVNYNVRYYPICREIRARIARGDIGRVLSVTGSYTQDWLLDPGDYNWRVEPDGGTNLRAMADIGTHWMDLAQFVTSRPITDVCAALATFHARRLRPGGSVETFSGPATAGDWVPITTDDYGAVLFRMADDVRGVFHASQMVAGRKNRIALEVAGAEGSLAWDSEQAELLQIGRRGRPNEVLHRDPALMDRALSGATHYPGGHAEGFADTFKHLDLDVYSWAIGGGSSAPSFPTFDDGDREVRLCEAIARSAASSGWVGVDQGPSSGTPS